MRSYRLAELLLKLLGRALEAPQGLAEGLSQLRKSLRTEYQKTDGSDYRHFREADAEDVHGEWAGGAGRPGTGPGLS